LDPKTAEAILWYDCFYASSNVTGEVTDHLLLVRWHLDWNVICSIL